MRKHFFFFTAHVLCAADGFLFCLCNVYAEVGHTDSGSENMQLLNCRLLKCDC